MQEQLYATRARPAEVKIQTSTHRRDAREVLSITVQRASGLEVMDLGGKSDPFVTIKVGKQAARSTSVKEKTLDPVWNEGFSFDVQSIDEAVILEVWDKDMASDDDFMGEVSLGAMRHLLERYTAMWHGERVSVMEKLCPRGKKKLAQGELYLELQLASNNSVHMSVLMFIRMPIQMSTHICC